MIPCEFLIRFLFLSWFGLLLLSDLMTLSYFLICSRPGILVLVNDCDWELEGGGSYQIKDNDNISFISTLHGG